MHPQFTVGAFSVSAADYPADLVDLSCRIDRLMVKLIKQLIQEIGCDIYVKIRLTIKIYSSKGKGQHDKRIMESDSKWTGSKTDAE